MTVTINVEKAWFCGVRGKETLVLHLFGLLPSYTSTISQSK